MRISELADATGVPTPTIKWYLREGLLPRGTVTARNQAQYDESHVRRLRLIRALVDVGGLSTQQVRDILTLVDDPSTPLPETVGAAHWALARPSETTPSAESLALADRYLQRRGWQVHPASPARVELAGLIELQRAVDPDPAGTTDSVLQGLDRYADAVEALAATEISEVPDDAPAESVVEFIVLGTVIAERTIASLRRLAQESMYLQANGAAPASDA